jgi:ATP-dependent DNA ligase
MAWMPPRASSSTRRGGPTSQTFDDGTALYTTVCEHRLEGVGAKKRSSLYRAGERGWIKDEEPELVATRSEIEAVQRSRERHAGLIAQHS